MELERGILLGYASFATQNLLYPMIMGYSCSFTQQVVLFRTGTHHPETKIAVAAVRVVAAAVRNRREASVAVPTTTAEDAARTRRGDPVQNFV